MSGMHYTESISCIYALISSIITLMALEYNLYSFLEMHLCGVFEQCCGLVERS